MIWCSQHNATLLATDRETKEQVCWKKYMTFIPSDVPYGPCRMVEALLIVKENGEWPTWAISIMFTQAPAPTALLDVLASVGGEK